jgi:hypothetical protein
MPPDNHQPVIILIASPFPHAFKEGLLFGTTDSFLKIKTDGDAG